jgi:hypothetical protein
MIPSDGLVVVGSRASPDLVDEKKSQAKPSPPGTHSSFPIPHPASVSARGKFPAGEQVGEGGRGGGNGLYIKDLRVPFHLLFPFFLLPSCCLSSTCQIKIIVHQTHPKPISKPNSIHSQPADPIFQDHGSMHM